ncbi:hypothetical protein B0H13DRAFT_2328367 [Mycena leptocephala]|nr:hypothetical protein B0H13DRAFT_2328367 [Mycena leptocephala]
MNGGRFSWSLGHFKCRAGSGAGLAAFLEQFHAAVAATCYAPGPLRNKILWLTQHNTEILADDRVHAFIRSLDVVFQASETEPLLALYGRPCSDSFVMWESLRQLFWDTTFTMGLAEFTPVSAKPRGSETRSISLWWLGPTKSSMGKTASNTRAAVEGEDITAVDSGTAAEAAALLETSSSDPPPSSRRMTEHEHESWIWVQKKAREQA